MMFKFGHFEFLFIYYLQKLKRRNLFIWCSRSSTDFVDYCVYEMFLLCREFQVTIGQDITLVSFFLWQTKKLQFKKFNIKSNIFI